VHPSITLYEHTYTTPSAIKGATRGTLHAHAHKGGLPRAISNVTLPTQLRLEDKDSDEEALTPIIGVANSPVQMNETIADCFVFPQVNPTSCEQDVKKRGVWSVRHATSHE
jgi:hypothetical protein